MRGRRWAGLGAGHQLSDRSPLARKEPPSPGLLRLRHVRSWLFNMVSLHAWPFFLPVGFLRSPLLTSTPPFPFLFYLC